MLYEGVGMLFHTQPNFGSEILKTYCSFRMFEHSYDALHVTSSTSSRFVVFYDYDKLSLSYLISIFLVYC